MMKTIYQLFLALTLAVGVGLDANAQSVRGTVKDAITGEPLVGATVKIAEMNGMTGAVSDIDGNFSINVGKAGRFTIETSYVGYEPSVMKEVMIAGSKETLLNIELRENNREISEVVVRPRVNKEATVNPLALAGGVMLSMEEASRYAGGYNDPARLVTAFAGISGSSDGNDISVHGNSPQTMQYRIEGIEVFNPTHFADLYGVGYGVVGALNSNVVGNSDFFVSTFNANYNNSLSGVFDIKLRPGNNNTYEHNIQLGTVGLEGTSEGPISKKNNSSYILNYRYGFTGFANKIGLLTDLGSVIDFQDFSVKLNFPTKKAGTFSVFGMFMFDKGWDEKLKLEDVHSLFDAGNNDYGLDNLLAGVTHKIHFGKDWTWRTTAAYNMMHTYFNSFYWNLKFDSNNALVGYGEGKEPFSYLKQNEDRVVFNTELTKQVTKKWLTQFGGEYSHRFFDLSYRSADKVYEPVPALPFYATKDNTGLANLFWTNHLELTNNFALNIGVSGNYFMLNKELSLEPRVSAKWDINEKNSLSLGYGLHSMVEKLDTYFYQDEKGNMVNKNLDLTKSHQTLLTFMHKFTDNLNLRFNAYYQYGFDVPVGIDGSNFCTVNREFRYIDEALVSKGNTRNYGADLTLEQYMQHGYYGQINGSLFKSEYRGVDKVWHNQKFDRGYMIKFLAGKEWMMGKRKQNQLNVSFKYTLQGGLRYTPIDLVEMQRNLAAYNAGKEALYEENVLKKNEVMSGKFDPSNVFDLTISYKINGKKVSHTIAFEGLNVLQTEYPFAQRFDLKTGQIRVDKGGVSLPNFFYRMDF